MTRLRAAACALVALTAHVAAADDLRDAVDRAARAVEPQVIAWRRDLHEHPELGNREVRTAALVAKRLRKLGLDVRTEVAHTGVVAVLRGAAGRPVVALRADMDALPVTEETGLPFASRVRTTYQGREVGVMHACGHDAHTAILLGVAEVLAGVRERLPGTVLFVFQPAEEGPPPGERGGASLMLEEGAFDDPQPDAIFGLHVISFQKFGEIGLVPGAAMASSDRLTVRVKGRSTHAALSVERRRPDRGRVADRARAARRCPRAQVDARIPSVVSIRRDPRRRAQQHHPRPGGAARHDPRARPRGARAAPRADPPHRAGDRRGRRRDRRGRDRRPATRSPGTTPSSPAACARRSSVSPAANG